MPVEQLNKKTVVKNTVLLYVRMFFLMVIGFITTRVVLRSLGEVDYGLNNAVAGFVLLFGVFSGSLNAAISRFITYELGRGDQDKLNTVFSTSVYIQLLMALFVAVLVETIGIWFLNNHMTIPPERMNASQWVLHFAVINTFITLTFVPYSAAIISHEKMGIYAYVSILEGGLNLIIAYLISLDLWGDRLIFYSGALCLSSIIVNVLYRFYCIKNFEECKLRRVFDLNLIKKMGGFAGWNMFGAVSGILNVQGINILFNMFLGPVVNAARGISNQTSGFATKFSNGFMTALNPQITKAYASGERHYMLSLVDQGTRMAFFLFFLIALPIFFETDTLLTLWLVNYPAHTVGFVRIALLVLLMDGVLANPLITVMLATGNIRNYQIVVGGLLLLEFPIAYVMLKLGTTPELVLFMVLAFSCICMMVRVFMLHRMIDFPIRAYLKNVIFRIAMVVILTIPLPLIIANLLANSIWSDIIVCVVSDVSAISIIWSFGLEKSEKQMLLKKIHLKA